MFLLFLLVLGTGIKSVVLGARLLGKGAGENRRFESVGRFADNLRKPEG